jgi:Tfp pilus assembly protein PilP
MWLAALVLFPAPLAGQGGPAPARQGQAALPAPAPLEAYSYRSEGRRDPFVSLVNRGIEAAPGQARPLGIAALSASEVALKGIVESHGRYLAIVQGPDGNRPYIVRANERFADGVVKAINADSMLILQEVNDPLSLTKQREIRKTLRAVEEVK